MTPDSLGRQPQTAVDRPAGSDLAPFLASLQLADSLFPSGLYTLSHGIESYAQADLLDAATLEQITAGLLRHCVGPADAVACAVAHRAASADPPDLARAEEADRRLTTAKLAREPRQTSIRLGRQLLALADEVFADPVAAAYRARVRERGLPGNQSVALGLLKAGLGIPLREAVAGELYAFAASCAGAALRMAMIDHRQAQQVVSRLRPVMAEATDLACAREAWEIGGSAPFAEIMTMRHEEADVRLFAT